MTRFSIVATDYEDHVDRDGLRLGIDSIIHQTFTDYELLVVHDGPRKYPFNELLPPNTRLIETPKHYGVYGTDQFYAGFGWGHHSRDLGMQEATGDYIVHFNIDNTLYPQALQVISDKIDETGAEVVVFACTHEKFGIKYFSGVPPVMGKVDLLQCVASRKAWESIGWWHRYDHSSDGYLFEELIAKYGYVHIPEVLGENR